MGQTVRTSSDGVAHTVFGDSVPAIEPPARSEGDLIGRYVVLEEVGSGGMGRVYRSYDPKLQREVAIKLLRTTSSGADARLMREARLMAQLAHPNVLPVYDADAGADEVYIAMEFVQGRTLEQWLADDKAPQREVIDVLIAAGRGLDAAHRAGLVHRDFKPSNVLIGLDGRARVMDFGLATAIDEPSGEHLAHTEATDPVTGQAPGHAGGSTADRELLVTQLTRTGVVLGTPAYMAPEQHLGRIADTRSDQFGYCATAFEALYGVRAFPGKTVLEVAASKHSRRLATTTPGKVPRFVHDAIVRGLEPDPGARWPSMEELLLALRRDPRRRRRHLWWMAGGVATVSTVGVAAFTGGRATTAQCKNPQSQLGDAWTVAREQAVAEAFHGIGPETLAADTYARVEAQLDEYAGQWTSEWVQACEDTHVRGTQSETLLDLRMMCLKRRRVELSSLVSVLEQADAKVMERAVRAAASLEPISDCADLEALTSAVAPPGDPELAQSVADAETRLAHARALRSAGKYTEGLEVAASTVERARALGYEPLLAEAAVRLCGLQYNVGQYAEAEDTCIEAHTAGFSSRRDDMAAQAAITLVRVIGRDPKRTDEARRWAQLADAAVRRIGGDDDARARLLSHSGDLYTNTGEYDEAISRHRRAVATLEPVYGSDSVRLAPALDNLGAALARGGKYEQAATVLARSLEIQNAALGPEHPDLGFALTNLGGVYGKIGDYAQAKVHLERALTVFESAFGPDHPHVASVLGNLSSIAYNQGQFPEAAELERRALEVRKTRLGPDHPDVARSHTNLGTALSELGKTDAAIEHHRRALAIREQALGTDHPEVALSLSNLGGALADRGEYNEALRLMDRALEIREGKFGPDHPAVAWVLAGIGQIHLQRNEPAEAIEPLVRALAIRDQHPTGPQIRGQERFRLARALWDSGRDRTEARSQAQAAIADFREFGDPGKVHVTEIEDWLAHHGQR